MVDIMKKRTIRRSRSNPALLLGSPRRRVSRGFTEASVSTPGSLNIKNDETCRLIRELAEMTGETMTGAVTEAVRERLGRVRQERAGGLADRLLAIGRDCANRLGDEYRGLDHDALLYDERGLPR
jgi:antitoxin VapB